MFLLRDGESAEHSNRYNEEVAAPFRLAREVFAVRCETDFFGCL